MRTVDEARVNVQPEESVCPGGQSAAAIPASEAQLLEQIRFGDAGAGQQFVRDYYTGIYQYLLYLTGRPEAAEDLAQETFVRAWRGIGAFEGRAPLRLWLHRIAHREFLRALGRQHAQASLEEVPELPAPPIIDWTEAIGLREAIRKLPVEEGEIVLLHYMQGYNCQEIAQIVRAPVGTVKYRLYAARSRLQRELGDGDLVYLNEPAAPMRQWAWLPLDQMHALETRLPSRAAGDRAAPGDGATKEEGMERREFLRQAAAGAAVLMLPEGEKEVIDSCLTQKVTLAFKGTALSDFCEYLRAETGVHLAAGASVADEKVTLFCQTMPLRDVMRQLSRPFGYLWLRSRTSGEYRYELVQDLRSQLLEEELRNRDRHAALLALEREVERYRPYLHLSPDEALARARSGARGGLSREQAEEKKRLEQLGGAGWGPIQIYFRLSSQELADLCAGKRLAFAAIPRGDERSLPPDVARGALQALRELRAFRAGGGWSVGAAKSAPEGVPLTEFPDTRGTVYLTLNQTELGHFGVDGGTGFAVWQEGHVPLAGSISRGPYAVGVSPAVRSPQNSAANAKLARDPALRTRVSLQPQPSCGANPSPSPPLRVGEGAGGGANAPRVTTADVLEALHRATGLPIVGDHYTRLYPRETVSVENLPLFEALNQLADAMRLRWTRDGGWLEFRSTSFYDDRLKEVPNRLLNRWASARQAHGALTLDDLVEIAQLSDVQLAAGEMAEGARDCFGLAEWDLVRDGLQPHLRFLAELSPAQRQQAASAEGLPFDKMTLPQQQRFVAVGLGDMASRIKSWEELSGATVRVEYTQPRWFQWGPAPVPAGRPVIGPWSVRERTQEAALHAARRIDPAVDATQLVPTELDLRVVYRWGVTSTERSVRMVYPGGGECYTPW
jgi:RNA polymerase sigma-70 factor (ECF subfamily)